jgi:multidrug efflux system outer membrane protein
MKLLLAFVTALKLLASCVPPVDRLPLPPPLPQTYRSGTTDPSSLGDEHWQQLFLDPQLRSLVGTALVNNAGINIEVQRVYAAEAVLGQITARQRPNVSIDLSASYQRINGPQSGGVSSSETITPSLLATTASPYDVDLFGALRYATAAQRARLLASDASRQAVITRVVGDAATAYFTIQELYAERDITELAIANRQSNLAIVVRQVEGGTATLQTQRQAETALYTVTSQRPDIERQIGEQENLLATLLGRYPAAIPRGLPLEAQLADLDVPPAGLPGQLLLRRPDIRSAEYVLVSDNFEVASARAAIFPQLVLGSSAAGVGGIIVNGMALGPQGLLTLVPSLLQTLGDGGFKRSTVKFDRAQRELDLYAYLRTIQTAMQGVANGLLDYARQREAVTQQILLTGSTRQYASLANLRYTGGVGSYIDVLDSESRYFNAEITLAQTQLAERLAELNLYAALGGGWQDAPPAASAGSPIPALSAPTR